MAHSESVKDSTPQQPRSIGDVIAGTPCLRSSLLYGVSAWTAIGLGTFLNTSNARKAVRAAFGSFLVVFVPYSVYCRYQYSKMTIAARVADMAIREKQHEEIKRIEGALQRDSEIDAKLKDLHVTGSVLDKALHQESEDV